MRDSAFHAQVRQNTGPRFVRDSCKNPRRWQKRALLRLAFSGRIAAVCAACVACDIARTSAIAVEPHPLVMADSSRDLAFSTVRSLALGHGMTVRSTGNEEHWHECFVRANFTVCDLTTNKGVIVYLSNALSSRWTPFADSTRHELIDVLRSQFGSNAIRECKWRGNPDPMLAGCAPDSRSDST